MAYLTIQPMGDCGQFYLEGPRNYNGDSGFDLFSPRTIIVPAGARGFKLDHQIRVVLSDVYNNSKPFMLCPRSSMGAKTPLRLSNSIGIIDKTYRGNIIALLDNISDEDYQIQLGDRLVQIVQFSGEPITNVEIGIIDKTERGEGAFGSTGK